MLGLSRCEKDFVPQYAYKTGEMPAKPALKMGRATGQVDPAWYLDRKRLCK